MNSLEMLEIDPGRLAERRRLSRARHRREGEREALLERFTRKTARADALRRLVGTYDGPGKAGVRPELCPMLDWAKAELNGLEDDLRPEQLGDLLRERGLFPVIDTLADPLGEPPARRSWGR